MAKTRFCIICGEPFETDDPGAVFCPAHEGTPKDSDADSEKKGFIDRGDKGMAGGDDPYDALTHPQDFEDWQVGDVILDTYEVKGSLGKGGFGKVYRVQHTGWNMDLAVKRALNLDENNKAIFTAEAEHWIDLGLHPHIISCYYVRNINGFPHTFAELAEGGSLESWIQGEMGYLYDGDHRQVLARLLDIAIQFAWGLGYAHEKGLVHQDVKSHNALMTPEGVLKVTDFGLAKAKGLAQSGMEYRGRGDLLVSGGGYTPAYCSPEQAARMKLSFKTDIWSWGVSVLEMFNGGVSWMGGQIAASALESYLGRAGDEEDIPPMPNGLAALLHDCFRQNPQERPADMLTVSEKLQSIYRQEIGKDYPRTYPHTTELLADSLNNKAISLLDLGHEADALENWRTAKANHPHHPETVYNLGYWLWQHGRQTDQTYLEQINAVCAQHPERADLDWLAGVVYAEIGNLEAADKWLKQAWNQGHWEAGLLCAACLAAMDTPSEGQRLYQEVWSLHKEEILQKYGTAEDVWHLLLSHPLPWRHCDLRVGEHSPQNTFGMLKITPDGRYALAATRHEPIVFDLKSEGAIATFKQRYKFDTTVVGIGLSPDGKRAITLVNDPSIVYWDAMTGEVTDMIKPLPEYPGINDITPDLKTLVYLDYQHNLCVWDLQQKQCLLKMRMPVEVPQQSHIINRLIAISGDGRFCLLILRDEIFGIQLPQGNLRFHQALDLGGVRKLVMTADGHKALIGGDKGQIWLMDVATRTYEPLTGLEHHISNLAITPDARYALSSSRGEYLTKDNTLRLWDLSKKQCIWTSEKQPEEIYAIAISNDAAFAYSYGQYGPLQRFQIMAGKEVHARRFSPLPKVFARPLSGSKVVEIVEQSQDRFSRAVSLEKEGHWSQAYNEYRLVQKESLDPWEEKVQTALQRVGAHGHRSGLHSAALKTRLSGQEGRLFSLALRPNTQQVLTGGDAYELWWWDFSSGSVLGKYDCNKTSIKGITIDPTGQYALLGGGGMNIYGDYLLRVFSFRERRFVNQIDLTHHMTLDVVYGPTASLAAALSDRFVFIINPLTGVVYHRLKGHKIHFGGERDSAGTPTCAAFFEDGRRILSGGDDQVICLWDISTGKRLQRFEAPKASVDQVLVMPGGRQFISGHYDHLLRVWDLQRDSPLFTIDTGGRIEKMVLTSDARFVFSSGEDNAIKVWDLHTHQQCGLLEGHGNLVSGLALANEERWLFSSSWDGTVGVWLLDWAYSFD
jgi:WD40 repeat protein/serine/threonine protein kinase